MSSQKPPRYIEMLGLHEAVVGYAMRLGQITLVYDFTKIVKLLMRQQRLTLDEAISMAEKIEETWLGEGTPIIFHGVSYNDIREIFGDGQAHQIN